MDENGHGSLDAITLSIIRELIKKNYLKIYEIYISMKNS